MSASHLHAESDKLHGLINPWLWKTGNSLSCWLWHLMLLHFCDLSTSSVSLMLWYVHLPAFFRRCCLFLSLMFGLHQLIKLCLQCLLKLLHLDLPITLQLVWPASAGWTWCASACLLLHVSNDKKATICIFLLDVIASLELDLIFLHWIKQADQSNCSLMAHFVQAAQSLIVSPAWWILHQQCPMCRTVALDWAKEHLHTWCKTQNACLEMLKCLLILTEQSGAQSGYQSWIQHLHLIWNLQAVSHPLPSCN